MVAVDMGSVLKIGEALVSLKSFIEKFGKGKPDAVSALTLVSHLQKYIDELRTQNEELKRKYEEADLWKTRTAGLDFFTTPGGATVYAKHGQPPYFCPPCFDKHALNPLQRRLYMGDCPGCKACYTLDHHEPVVQVLQRRRRGGTIHF